MGKEQQLWQSVEDMADWTGREALLLQAICRLLAHSKKPSRAKPAPLPYGRAKLVQARLQLECPDLNVSTYSAGELGRLTRTIKSIHDFKDGDIDLLIRWVNDGGVRHWETPPTFYHVVNHFSNWLAQAREYDADEPETYVGSSVR